MLGGVAQAGAQLDGRRHVHVDRERIVGRGRLRFSHPPRHRLLEPSELTDLDSALGTGSAAGALLPIGGRLDIRLGDPPARPGALDRLKRDPRFLREAPRDRRGLYALAAAVLGVAVAVAAVRGVRRRIGVVLAGVRVAGILAARIGVGLAGVRVAGILAARIGVGLAGVRVAGILAARIRVVLAGVLAVGIRIVAFGFRAVARIR